MFCFAVLLSDERINRLLFISFVKKTCMPDLVNGSKRNLGFYYITEIIFDVHNSKYGDIIVVYANPAWEGEFGMWEYTVGIHGETECFLFANNPLIKGLTAI